ncbi:MAG: glycoside hydrolase family 88 protein [Fidelibacterota bacterium]|nr:MAG: glycoside hydrolase family 88 protein [Candidatus Neomarinimicrobiota bacterium]
MKTSIIQGNILHRLILACVLLSAMVQAQSHDSLIHNALDFAEYQLGQTVIEINDSTQFPRSTLSDGSWGTRSSSSWTSGFFPGCLWYLYEHTSNHMWKSWARSWTAGVEPEQYNTGTHDVGFMIYCSAGNGYRLTGDEHYRAVILRAAQSLTTRYNPTVGCIRSWDNRTFPVIIDNMMNLELLFWASKNGGDTTWYDMAVSHALRTMEDHVRADGSTYQIVDYNPVSGAIIQKETSQGYQTESTWARGQSWGLYGFTMTYRETGDDCFLNTAKKLADYVIDHLPGDNVPYWDYEAPEIPSEEKDASAAAIAASGLLELCALVPEDSLEVKYRNAAESILGSLVSDSYLAEGSISHGILLHGVGNHNKGTEVDVSLIYADYYFIEALLRYEALASPNLALEGEKYPMPTSLEIYQNYPNPFNPVTTIPYRIDAGAVVAFSVYSLAGQRVYYFKTGYQRAGNHRFLFDGGMLASGTYLVNLQAGSNSRTLKMTLLR